MKILNLFAILFLHFTLSSQQVPLHGQTELPENCPCNCFTIIDA